MKNIILILTITLLTSCATLNQTQQEEPATPIEKMSTYQLQNEYLELEHKIIELEKGINETRFSLSNVVNVDLAGNSAIWLAIAFNALNVYNMNNMTTEIEKYKLRLSEIKTELEKRGMY